MSDQQQEFIPLSDGRPIMSDTLSDSPSDASDNVRAGGKISVRLDQQMSDDVLTIMSAGANQTDAVRYALAVAAQACRGAWTLGYTLPRALPIVTAFRVDMGNGRFGDMGVRRPNGGV